jgi:exodeoxyribonuclease III
MKLISWNVNGIRAAVRKDFFDYFDEQDADVFCVQESKAHPEQLDETLLAPDGYYAYWHAGERKGYSGVGTFTKKRPISVSQGTDIIPMDKEGRVLRTEFEKFYLYNIYFPNGTSGDVRLEFKLKFYDQILKHFENARKIKPLVICGDVNTAHHEIDIARPKENEKTSGFLRVELDWLDKIEKKWYIDTFRLLHPDKKDMYSWWSFRANARARNVGWRIDYFYVTPELKDNVVGADIQMEAQGSDHAPIHLELKL